MNATYNVGENEILNTFFQLNVKGETIFGGVLVGKISAVSGGTASECYNYRHRLSNNDLFLFIIMYIGSTDFEELIPISVMNNAQVRIFTTNDDITLEYDDSIILVFTSIDRFLIPALEATGEYIRDTANVNIIDDDSKYTSIQSFHNMKGGVWMVK